MTDDAFIRGKIDTSYVEKFLGESNT